MTEPDTRRSLVGPAVVAINTFAGDTVSLFVASELLDLWRSRKLLDPDEVELVLAHFDPPRPAGGTDGPNG